MNKTMYSIWVYSKERRANTGPWEHLYDVKAPNEQDAIEIAKCRSGMDKQYKAYETVYTGVL